MGISARRNCETWGFQQEEIVKHGDFSNKNCETWGFQQQKL